MNRSAGILLPIFSLPSPYGIGSLGREARAFADFLHDAGQSWWQVLPVGLAGAGESPYASPSTFAGNPLYIDLEQLAEEGLLTAAELRSARLPETEQVDYAAVKALREPLLRKAFSRVSGEQAQAAREFAEKNPWVREFALYQAARVHFGRPWYAWPDEALRRHEPWAVEHWRGMLAEDVAYHTWVQYWFFRQWAALKEYVNGLGVKIIGDIPIYVSLDSADVWAEREQFLLDPEGKPAKVAGVPPDYFSAEGQLWGNPLYDWDHMKADGFGWWIRRVDGAIRLFDVIRIDHFRGLESYWAVPAEAETAKEGAWEKGPGMDLLRVLKSWFWYADVEYIAEDLGLLTDAVHDLRKAASLPGMKVLQFAFDGPYNTYLPHNHEKNCVCYTGTHDNDTLLGWYDKAERPERDFVEQYLGVRDDAEAVRKAVLRCGQGSVAELFVAQMQDYLALDGAARINTPGVAEGNWRWRMLPDKTTPALAEEIRTLTHTFGRC